MSPNHDDAVEQSTLSTCYDATARAWKASLIRSNYLRYSWILSMHSVFHITPAAQIQRRGALAVVVAVRSAARDVQGVIVAGDVVVDVAVAVDSKVSRSVIRLWRFSNCDCFPQTVNNIR